MSSSSADKKKKNVRKASVFDQDLQREPQVTREDKNEPSVEGKFLNVSSAAATIGGASGLHFYKRPRIHSSDPDASVTGVGGSAFVGMDTGNDSLANLMDDLLL
eukprot:gene494-416_t